MYLEVIPFCPFCTLYTMHTAVRGGVVQPSFAITVHFSGLRGSKCTLVLQDILVKMFNSYLEGTPYAIVAQQLGNNLLNNDQVRMGKRETKRKADFFCNDN
jgi:hypothetical protein